MSQYEAMFLFDPTFGSAFDKCEAEIRRLMERAQAEIILCQKWDERRLAYKIKGRKRGVYVLVYFNAPGDKIGGLERDAKLSENILRVLILNADGITRETMEQVFHQRQAEQRAEGEFDAGPGHPGEGGADRFGRGGRRRRGGAKEGGAVPEPTYDAVGDLE